MTRFDMFCLLFEPANGWRNYEDAMMAFQVWEKKPMNNPKDYSISHLRIVKVYFRHEDGGRRGEPTIHYMHQEEIHIFLEALVALHHSPGINPYSGGKAAELWEVVAGTLETDTKSYWWSSPTLSDDHAVKGAQLNRDIREGRMWAHPRLLDREADEMLA